MKNIIFLFFLLLLQIRAQYQNVRVSNISSKDPEEVTIAINPSNPNQLAAGANINYFYASSDGGLTWSEQSLSSTLGVWGDPVVIYNNDGDLFFSHLSDPIEGHWIDRIVVQKSSDNGITWSDGTGIGFKMLPVVQDKEWLTVDYTTSKFRNNIYMAWTEFDKYGSTKEGDSTRIRFSSSSNKGNSWSDPIVISDVSGNCIDDDLTVEGAVPAVGPNGEIYISWAGPLGIVFDKSMDGGKTFGRDIIIADQPGGWSYSIPGISRCNGMPITVCDISKSQYKGNIYINWSDQRNGEGNTDIFLIKSEDGGTTWSEIKRVNNDNTDRHQFFTWMCIDPISGHIYFVFYDRRNTSGNETEVFMARSKDGGETFENFKISENTFTPIRQVFFGDYINIAAYNGMIRPIWMRMDNSDLSVWTAIINDSDITEIDEELQFENSFKLFQNYPNPFNPTTLISYQLPNKKFIEVILYDALGRKIRILDKGFRESGIHELTLNAEDMNSGIYFYRISDGENFISRKLILLK